jgi:hypothetical protein
VAGGGGRTSRVAVAVRDAGTRGTPAHGAVTLLRLEELGRVQRRRRGLLHQVRQRRLS